MNPLRVLSTLLLLLMLAQASCRHPAPTAASGKDSLLIFIMAGQSNMAGRGQIEPEDTVTDPRILLVDESNVLRIAREPFHAGSKLDCGRTFAQTLLAYLPPGKKICLVPCAVSSTSVQDWRDDAVYIRPVYSAMLARTAAAQEHGTLKGILWHQGETNANDTAASIGYPEALEAFISKLRRDEGQPRLPFYMGYLAGWCRKPYTGLINAGMDRAAAELDNVFLIPTADLPPLSDSLHFNNTAQRELGRRYALAAAAHL